MKVRIGKGKLLVYLASFYLLPRLKSAASSLAIEINPVGESGSPTKKRGVVIRSSSELGEITKLLSNPKLSQLAKSIDEVNPELRGPKTTNQSDVFEI
jgi:hypothetical protein